MKAKQVETLTRENAKLKVWVRILLIRSLRLVVVSDGFGSVSCHIRLVVVSDGFG